MNEGANPAHEEGASIDRALMLARELLDLIDALSLPADIGARQAEVVGRIEEEAAQL